MAIKKKVSKEFEAKTFKKGSSGNKGGRPKLIINKMLDDLKVLSNKTNKILRKQDMRWYLTYILSSNKNDLKKLLDSDEVPVSMKQIIQNMVDTDNGGEYTKQLLEIAYFKK